MEQPSEVYNGFASEYACLCLRAVINWIAQRINRNLSKTALHTGGLRIGFHGLMTVERLIHFQLLKGSNDRIAPFIFHFKFYATFFLHIYYRVVFYLVYVFFLFKGGPLKTSFAEGYSS